MESINVLCIWKGMAEKLVLIKTLHNETTSPGKIKPSMVRRT